MIIYKFICDKMIDDSFGRICNKLLLSELLLLELVCKEFMNFIRKIRLHTKSFKITMNNKNILETHQFSNVFIYIKDDITLLLPYVKHCRKLNLAYTNIDDIEHLTGNYREIILPYPIADIIIDHISYGTLKNISLVNTSVKYRCQNIPIIIYDYKFNDNFNIYNYINLGMSPRKIFNLLLYYKIYELIEPILSFNPICDDLIFEWNEKYSKYQTMRFLYDCLTYTMILQQYWLTKILIKHINIKIYAYKYAVLFAFDHKLIDIIDLLYQYGSKYILFDNNYYIYNCKNKKCIHKKCHDKKYYKRPI